MPETQTRREREGKLIVNASMIYASNAEEQRWYSPAENQALEVGFALIEALKAAHKREDAIRKYLENGVRYDGMSPLSCRELLEKLDAERP